MRTFRRLDIKGPAREIRKAINSLADMLQAQRIRQGRGYKIKETSTGIILNIDGGDPVESGSDVEIKRFQITGFPPNPSATLSEITSHYLICKEVDVTGSGFVSEKEYNVLIPYSLQTKSDEQAISGTTEESLEASVLINSRELVSQRDVSGTTKNFTYSQDLVPNYVQGTGFGIENATWLYALNIGQVLGQTYGGSDIEWIDLNVDARRWRMADRIVEVCVNNETKNIIIMASEVGEDAV